MAQSVRALINPAMLVWARTSSGFDVDSSAKKASVSRAKYESWEAGESRPTINQLRALANAFKRPIAVFYLSEVPQAFQPMHDFRRLPREVALPPSPALMLAIRSARERRETAIELLEDLGEEAPAFRLRIELGGDPESMGQTLREFLGITEKTQSEWGSDYDALNGWRSAIENAGILVFQFSRVAVSEARGFSISEPTAPAIAVNNTDLPYPRSFSLLHELTHIALQDGGLCDFREGAPDLESTRIEIYCNRIAAAAQLPLELLGKDRVVVAHGRSSSWSNEELREISGRLHASMEVVLRRMLTAGLTSTAFYREWRDKAEETRRDKRGSDKPKTGGPSPSVLAVSLAGPMFTRLALTSYYQDKITVSDLSDILGVRLKHIGKIEQAVLGRAVAFEVGVEVQH